MVFELRNPPQEHPITIEIMEVEAESRDHFCGEQEGAFARFLKEKARRLGILSAVGSVNGILIIHQETGWAT